jgi:hypothetical protein
MKQGYENCHQIFGAGPEEMNLHNEELKIRRPTVGAS